MRLIWLLLKFVILLGVCSRTRHEHVLAVRQTARDINDFASKIKGRNRSHAGCSHAGDLYVMSVGNQTHLHPEIDSRSPKPTEVEVKDARDDIQSIRRLCQHRLTIVFLSCGVLVLLASLYKSYHFGEGARASLSTVSMDLYSGVEKFTKGRLNRRIFEHATLAGRGTVFALIGAAPIIFPNAYFGSFIQSLQDQSWLGPFAIGMLFFTLCKTVGETLKAAWGGIFGTFLAVFNVWFIFGIFPNGTGAQLEAEIRLPFLGSCLHGVFFTFAILWLNLGKNTKVFALSTFVWHWMSFLNPESKSTFSRGFRVDMQGEAFAALAMSFTGVTLAILASLLPYPLFAIRKAKDTARSIHSTYGEVWEQALTYFCEDRDNAYRLGDLLQVLDQLQVDVNSCESLVEQAWYECLGFGSWGQSRPLLLKLGVVLQRSIDRIRCMLQVCKLDEFDDEYTSIRRAMRDEVNLAYRCFHSVLGKTVDIVCHGRVEELTEDVISELKSQVAETLEAEIALTRRFVGWKKEHQMEGKLAEAMLDEHTVFYCICSCSHSARRFASELLEVIALAKKGSSYDHRLTSSKANSYFIFDLFWSIFDKDVLWNPEHLSFVLRNGLSILIAFYVGYVGFEGVYKPYAAVGANNLAIMLSSDFAGSAILGHLTNLQSVAIGSVVGQLLHAYFTRCTFWGLFLTQVFFGFSAFLCLYTYFHSTRFNSLGLLVLFFLTKAGISPCDSQVANVTDSSYTSISLGVLSILLAVAVDGLIHQKRASEQSLIEYRKYWEMMRSALHLMFDPQFLLTCSHRSEMLQALKNAADLGHEAALEPRPFKLPWRTHLFNTGLKCAHEMRISISCMEASIALDSEIGKSKAPVFKYVLGLSEFSAMGKVIFEKIDLVGDLLSVFEDAPALYLNYTSARLSRDMQEHMHVGLDDAEAFKPRANSQNACFVKHLEKFSELRKSFMASANAEDWCNRHTEDDETTSITMEQLPAAKMSVLLGCLESILVQLRDLQQAIMRQT